MNSEPLPLESPPVSSTQHDLNGVISDSRRRQRDIFQQRESATEPETEAPVAGPVTVPDTSPATGESAA